MRQERTIQASIFDVFSQHELGRELKAMSDLLDDHREVCGWVAAELRRHGLKPTGRKGLPAETVLRCGVLKQHRQLSYQELAFYLTDSATFRAFARLPVHWTPKKSVLQNTISAISAATWERINRHLLRQARTAKLESGEMLRVDSTVTDAPVHPPTDSSLLWDSVRMMVRLLGEADDLLAGLGWRNHSRRAKKRSRSIQFCRSADKRKRLYRDLLKVTRATLDYVDAAMARLTAARLADIKVEAWLAAVRQYRPLIARIIAQTERRVLDGEQVPAADKLVSLFEPHTDIIVKGSREVQYGHKLNLSTGKTGARMVPLTPAVAGVLAEIPRVPDNPWVIAGQKPGARMTNVNDPWLVVRARAGLEDVRIHDLRHSWASRALALGESLSMIGKLLGHNRIETTARYAHLARDTEKASAAKVAGSIGADILPADGAEAA